MIFAPHVCVSGLFNRGKFGHIVSPVQRYWQKYFFTAVRIPLHVPFTVNVLSLLTVNLVLISLQAHSVLYKRTYFLTSYLARWLHYLHYRCASGQKGTVETQCISCSWDRIPLDAVYLCMLQWHLGHMQHKCQLNLIFKLYVFNLHSLQ